MKPTITKKEIAEHYVTVEQLHEDLTRLIKEHFARKKAQQEAAVWK